MGSKPAHVTEELNTMAFGNNAPSVNDLITFHTIELCPSVMEEIRSNPWNLNMLTNFRTDRMNVDHYRNINILFEAEGIRQQLLREFHAVHAFYDQDHVGFTCVSARAT